MKKYDRFMYKKNFTFERNKQKVNGYTLIELLIVLLITILLAGIGVIRYRDFQRRQAVKAATRTIITDLRTAQERALAGTKPAGCTTLESYIVRRLSNTSYEIRARCQPGPTDIVTKTSDQVSFSVKHPGITMNAWGDVIFKTRGYGVENAITITATQTGTTFSDSVDITRGGEIK